MRAFEIALFLIVVQASIGFFNSIDAFDTDYYNTPQNQYNYEVSDLAAYSNITRTIPLLDYMIMTATWMWDTLFIMLDIVFSVVIIFPIVINTFNIPVVLSVFMQVGIYVVYATGYIQWKSGKGLKYFE